MGFEISSWKLKTFIHRLMAVMEKASMVPQWHKEHKERGLLIWNKLKIAHTIVKQCCIIWKWPRAGVNVYCRVFNRQ
jgi:hypothetical protein